jgi:hypothetical protein
MAGVGSYESVERVAWHEAGHAVANHRLGHGVIEVKLHDTGVNCQADRWDYRSALPTRPDGLYSGTELVNAARPYAVAILAGNARRSPARRARNTPGLLELEGPGTGRDLATTGRPP